MSQAQKKLQELSDSYQSLQADLSAAIEARQKLESQQQENSTQIGPALLAQDATEALMSVNARLDFIDKEIARFEAQIRDLQGRGEALRGEIVRIQREAQGEQGQQQVAV
ncbi:hypothetical protein EJ07DRAFT_175031 [Lizonia empirigonia]|nr:hypothetical protein EJ07DRAFT_175031 [Lizonia empirigonia]